MMALIKRLLDVGIIADSTYRNLFRSPARAWLKTEPAPLDRNGEIAMLEKPQRFESLVYRALAEGLIPATQAAGLLKNSVSDVECALKGPR
jgi:hypothetical protein